jgi:hypothetical protein
VQFLELFEMGVGQILTPAQIVRLKEREQEKLQAVLDAHALVTLTALARRAKVDVPGLSHIVFGMGGYNINGQITYVDDTGEKVTHDLTGVQYDVGTNGRVGGEHFTLTPYVPKSLVVLIDACRGLADADILPVKDIRL